MGNASAIFSGIIDEHINTRTNVGLFDVSHMGRFEVKGPDAYDYLQTLVTNDISKLNDHQALYSPMCYDNGGIIDDLIIYMINREKFLIVVNASIGKRISWNGLLSIQSQLLIENNSE